MTDVGSWKRLLGIVVPLSTSHGDFPIFKYWTFDSPKLGEVAVVTVVGGCSCRRHRTRAMNVNHWRKSPGGG